MAEFTFDLNAIAEVVAIVLDKAVKTGAISIDAETEVPELTHESHTYGEAIEVLMETNNLLPSAKIELTRLIKKGKDEDYYRAVTAILKSNVLGSSMKRLIEELS